MKIIATIGISLLIAVAVACGGQASDDALFQASAECLHDKGLAQLAGDNHRSGNRSPTYGPASKAATRPSPKSSRLTT